MLKKRFYSAIITALAAQLCACTLLTAQPPDQIYTLDPATWNEPSHNPLPININVTKPDIAPGLDTYSIALTRPNHEFSYFSETRWPSTSADMIRELIIESLQNYNAVQAISSELLYPNPNYRMLISVQDFQAEYAARNTDKNAPIAHVTLNIEIVNVKDRRLVISFRETEKTSAASNTMADIIAAFNTAFQQVSKRATERATAAIASAEGSGSGVH
jgi:ABC-type uncharacterized transport system auxiliary subunit